MYFMVKHPANASWRRFSFTAIRLWQGLLSATPSFVDFIEASNGGRFMETFGRAKWPGRETGPQRRSRVRATARYSLPLRCQDQRRRPGRFHRAGVLEA